jgi:hypothetical protein
MDEKKKGKVRTTSVASETECGAGRRRRFQSEENGVDGDGVRMAPDLNGLVPTPGTPQQATGRCAIPINHRKDRRPRGSPGAYNLRTRPKPHGLVADRDVLSARSHMPNGQGYAPSREVIMKVQTYNSSPNISPSSIVGAGSESRLGFLYLNAQPPVHPARARTLNEESCMGLGHKTRMEESDEGLNERDRTYA